VQQLYYAKNNQLKLPLKIEVLITEDDSVRLIGSIIEEMDLHLNQLLAGTESPGDSAAAKEPGRWFGSLDW